MTVRQKCLLLLGAEQALRNGIITLGGYYNFVDIINERGNYVIEKAKTIDIA